MIGRRTRFGLVPLPVLVLGLFACGAPEYPEEPAVEGRLIYESVERPDMLDPDSPPGLKVVQITTNMRHPSRHVYMESYVFTPDSKRFVYFRYREADMSQRRDPPWDLWLCDVSDNFALRQLTDENRVKGPSVTSDGEWMYYVVDNTSLDGGSFALKRVSLKNYRRQTLMTIDGPIPETDYRVSRFYGLTSISSDDNRLCAAVYLGDGKDDNAPFGILVFDIIESSVRVFPLGHDSQRLPIPPPRPYRKV